MSEGNSRSEKTPGGPSSRDLRRYGRVKVMRVIF